MGAKKFSHTHRSTMCGLKKLASMVFLESWKVLAERRWWPRRRKRTKNSKSPVYPGWLKYAINSSLPNGAYMWQWIQQVLVQVMACHLLGAKPLPEPMLTYCQLDPLEQTSVNFKSKYEVFHSWKCIWKCRLRNGAILSRERWVNIKMSNA